MLEIKQEKMVAVRILRTDDCHLEQCQVGQIATCLNPYADYLIRKGVAEYYNGTEKSTVTLCEGAEINADKKDKDKQQRIQTSLFVDEYHQRIYEEVYDSKRKVAKYACFDSYKNTISYKDCINITNSDDILIPIVDDEVQTLNIKLPSQAQEYGDEKQLISDIQSFIYKYVDLPEDFRYYCALNILKSWVYERFHTLNYLRFQGEPGCGKSRALDVIGYLHYKPIATSGTVTAAPVYRLITKWAGTLIIDEADRKQSDETDEIIKIINQGYEKGRCVLRCNPLTKTDVEFFETYCPKVLATRHKFDDPATETRCMTQIMTGTDRKDIISSIDDNFWQEMQVLRNKLLLWRFRNYFKIQPTIGESLDWGNVEPRLKQVNVGFAALIYNNPEALQQFMNHVQAKQNEINSDRSETYEGQIIDAFSRMILEDKPLIAKDIISAADLQDRMGRPWKPRLLSSYMKTLGFAAAKLKWIDGTATKVYEYQPEMMLRLLRKYLMPDQYQKFMEVVNEKAKAMQILLKCDSDNHVDLFSYIAKNPNCLTVLTDIYGNSKTVRVITQATDSYNPNRSGMFPLERLGRLVWLERLGFYAKQIGAVSEDGSTVAFQSDALTKEFGEEFVQSLLSDGTLMNIKAGFYSVDKKLLVKQNE